jgi:type VI secretion system secreted protein VgrG
MESEGIFYYFEHHPERHVMVITDSVAAYQPLPHYPTLRMDFHTGNADVEDIVRSLEIRTELLSARWTTRDYHFELPRSPLEVESPALHAVEAASHLARYDFPGGYSHQFNETTSRLDQVRPEGDTLIQLRMEAEEARYEVARGHSDVRALGAGYRVDIVNHHDHRSAGQFLITQVSHKGIQSPSYVSEEFVPSHYQNRFEGIPANVVFRPPIKTAKPLVQGPQTALVVDEQPSPKDEIWPDKFGRVRVRFPWDRQKKYSCWLRVAQAWAGRGWGQQWIPRVGDEVLVDFLEGNPDAPIVVGSVYNSDNMPPFRLPESKTQSGIVTRSTKEGTQHQFNMLRFDDKKGAEQVMIRSQRRADVRAYGNYFETNHANRHTYVGWKDERTEESGGDHYHTVNGDHNVHVLKNRYEAVDEKVHQTVKLDVVQDLQANEVTLVTAKNELNAREIIFEATTKIGLKCGPSFISIEPSGITIYGPMVRINSGGYGTETSDPWIDGPLDAELSDNGEPGFLERVSRGSGGLRRRPGRRLRSQHYVYPPRTGESAQFTAMRNTLNTSAQGRHALEVFERYRIGVTTNSGGTEYSRTANAVNLDPARTDSPASGFVHEMGHAQARNEGGTPNPNTMNRQDYIDAELAEDADCERRAYEAEQQMNDAGGSEHYNSMTRGTYDRTYQDERARLHRDHPEMSEEEVNRRAHDRAEAAILQDYQDGNVTTGNSRPPTSYRDYWGNAWDANDRRRRAAGAGSGPAPAVEHPHSH